MEIKVKKIYFHIFSFFLVSNMILSDALILLVSQLQTQQVMTSQISSHVQGGPKKVSHYQVSSLNRIKNSD